MGAFRVLLENWRSGDLEDHRGGLPVIWSAENGLNVQPMPTIGVVRGNTTSANASVVVRKMLYRLFHYTFSFFYGHRDTKDMDLRNLVSL